MTIFGRFSPLNRKLLIRSGGCLVAPVRVHGKLDIATEYLTLGCDDLPVAKAFSQWVHDGYTFCQQSFGTDPLQLVPLRLFVSAEGGRVWILACLWDSCDKRSEHGAQRRFPFVLFVAVPAVLSRSHLADVPLACEPIWAALEACYNQLGALSGRPEFLAFMRGQLIRAPEGSSTYEEAWFFAAQATPITAWHSGLDVGDTDLDSVLTGLQQQLLANQSSAGDRFIWRLPASAKMDTMIQLGCWLRWLARNIRRQPAEVSILIPAGTLKDGSNSFCVLFGGHRPSDFVFLTSDAKRICELTGAPLPGSMPAPSWKHDFLAQLRGEYAIETASMADFANLNFPRLAY